MCPKKITVFNKSTRSGEEILVKSCEALVEIAIRAKNCNFLGAFLI